MFKTLFYQPVLNLVIALYNYLPGHDMTLVIIALVIIVNLALWPLGKKMLVNQKQIQDLQPKLDELKIIHKDDKQAFSQATMELYKQEKINPFSGCIVLIIQLPFFWAIFQVFRNALTGKTFTDLLYPFVADPGNLNTVVLNGFMDFGKPNLYLAIAASVAQFIKAKMMPQQKPVVKGEGSKDESMAAMMNKQMMYMGPVITFMACVNFPSGLAFYWLCFTLFSIVQQIIIFKQKPKNTVDLVDIKTTNIKPAEEVKEPKELK